MSTTEHQGRGRMTGPDRHRMKPRKAIAERRKAATANAEEQRTGNPVIDAINQRIDEMERTPGSGVAMCHAQGKTAVYISKDGKYLVSHPPHGPVTRKLRSPAARGQ